MTTRLYWIGRRTSPGWTWVKRKPAYQGYDFIAHNYVRSPWRVAALWIAAAAVVAFVGWGLGL